MFSKVLIMEIKFNEVYIKDRCFNVEVDVFWDYQQTDNPRHENDTDQVINFKSLLLTNIEEINEENGDLIHHVLLTHEQNQIIAEWVKDEIAQSIEKYTQIENYEPDYKEEF